MGRHVLAFAAVTIPLVLTPGIATTLVLRVSLLHGVGAGLMIATGAALASLAYGILSGSSTAVLLHAWPRALIALQLCGGAYLGYLGGRAVWRAMRQRSELADAGTHGGLGQGFLANALNPPVALFYFLIVPRFVPAGAPMMRSVMVLTAVHVTLAFTWHATCAGAAGVLSHLLSSTLARRAIDVTTGLVLIAFAIRMWLF
jgi:threonine/homoserine/homoserine lactone efflux protein